MKKMHVLVVANRKGGVAKTFSTYHVGYDRAERGSRVLFVDADNGRSLTHVLDKYVENVDNGLNAAGFLGEIIESDITIPVFKQYPNGGSISILRATDELVELESKMDLLKVARYNFKKIQNDYDMVVIDTSPNLNPLLLALLGIASHVLVPSPLSLAEMSGVRTLVNHIKLVKSKTNPSLNFVGILPSMVNSRSPNQMKALVKFKEAYGALVIPKHTVQRAAYEKAQDDGRPVWEGRMSGSGHKIAADEMREVCLLINTKIERS